MSLSPSRLERAPVTASGLCARPIVCRYRYCPTCRREWPARDASCPTCRRWLGEQPLERTEWRIAPPRRESPPSTGYEVIAAGAVVLRLIANDAAHVPIQAIAVMLREELQHGKTSSSCPVPERGWLVWTKEGLRPAFLQALEIAGRLTASLRRLEQNLPLAGRFRWGIWLDQYVLPCGRDGTPIISDVAAQAIFHFEADDRLLCSEALYEANRHWEHFVCVPRQLSSGGDGYGYRLLNHKRPSALDHAEAADASPFVGRDDELARLAVWSRESRTAQTRAALIAEAGSGKTRLIKEWQRRHPELRMLAASFSLFAGDLVSFASQLAKLPYPITADTLCRAIGMRIATDPIDALVLDDLHWADEESVAFLKRLLDILSPRAIFVLLVTRPSGRAVLASLRPLVALELAPLSSRAALELAHQLIGPGRMASMAARRSKGNPLFVTQFAAWAAETGDPGSGADAPHNLHQVIAARIAHLSAVRLAAIRQKLQWGSSLDHHACQQELDRLEGEIGLWLDRLETGDYGDRIEATYHLMSLERVDSEIFLASTLAGKPRARSSRLREAIDRLLAGSAKPLLAALKRRAINANDAEKANILLEAQRAATVLAGRYSWRLAAGFYELARRLAEPRQQDDFAHRLADCRRRYSKRPAGTPTAIGTLDIEAHPAVDALRLPDVWRQLALRYDAPDYFRRAADAADAIHDQALAAWARQHAISCVQG